jgi:hypothetical protein
MPLQASILASWYNTGEDLKAFAKSFWQKSLGAKFLPCCQMEAFRSAFASKYF